MSHSEEELRMVAQAAIDGNEALLEEFAVETWQQDIARGLLAMHQETMATSWFVVVDE